MNKRIVFYAGLLGFSVLATVCLCSTVAVAELVVELKVFPNVRTIQLAQGPAEIVMTGRTTANNIRFKWSYNGPGTFKEDRRAPVLVYRLPEKIEGETAQTIVTLKVTDDQGETATESVTFTLLSARPGAATPAQEPTTAPPSEPTPTPTIAPTKTPVPDSTATPMPIPTATPTIEPTPTPIPKSTATPTPTITPSPEPTPTPIPKSTATPTPTSTPSPKPTPKPMPTATPTPTSPPAATSTPLPKATPTPKPAATSTPQPTAIPTVMPEPAPTPTPLELFEELSLINQRLTDNYAQYKHFKELLIQGEDVDDRILPVLKAIVKDLTSVTQIYDQLPQSSEILQSRKLVENKRDMFERERFDTLEQKFLKNYEQYKTLKQQENEGKMINPQILPFLRKIVESLEEIRNIDPQLFQDFPETAKELKELKDAYAIFQKELSVREQMVTQ